MARDAAAAGDDRPPGALPLGYGRGQGGQVRPVWVRLPDLYPAPTGPGREDDPAPDSATTGAPVPPGQHGRLDLRREVIGWLHHWERDLDGHWYGLVDYSVPLVGDFRPATRVDCGLVPAAALRPRELQTDDAGPRYAP